MKINKNLPTPPNRRIAMHVTPAAERALRKGHPWLFEGAIQRQNREGQAGDLAVIFDRKDRFLAIGLYDPRSPLRVRILQHNDPVIIDQHWFRGRFLEASRKRDSMEETSTNGYRLVHGENDGLPGLVVDRYDHNYVIKLDTAAWIPRLADVVPALLSAVKAEHLVLRLSRSAQSIDKGDVDLIDGDVLAGAPLVAPALFKENGLKFEADLIQGQKTGFFFDQRENRAILEEIIAGRQDIDTLLNVFAYTGGFSLYAARAGTKTITSLDSSQQALDTAVKNFELNQDIKSISNAIHKLACGDAFQLLRKYVAEGRHYDSVVIDPPSFARRQSEVDQALNAYRRLTRLGLSLLRPGGLLMISSCSSRVGAEEFFTNIHRVASRNHRPLTELTSTGHALDHPVSFPQGAYLKCLFAIAD